MSEITDQLPQEQLFVVVSEGTPDLQPQIEKRVLTFGEKLVGITFNPSNDGDVSEIKTKCAELANLINERASHQEQSEISTPIYEGAIQRLLDAQMWLVKYVTLKY